MKNDYFIYKYDWEDGSVYVGQSSTTQHRYGIISSYKGCPKVYPKMKSHQKFKKEKLITGLTEYEVDLWEKWYILKYNSYCGDNSENKLGLNCNRGGQLSHIVSNETKKKISEHSFIKGKHQSEAVKKKIADTNSKSISQYSKNGEFIKEWNSMHDVERELKINHSSISKCCQGKLKSVGGYVWRYKI